MRPMLVVWLYRLPALRLKQLLLSAQRRNLALDTIIWRISMLV
jgi:hypothetical protein